ncbi:MAG: DUF5103 domain-containing protein [Flavobacteriales bacterium]|nr:MAG: DUF5103 domain-containing protein [Flavobacteriales bacterium]
MKKITILFLVLMIKIQAQEIASVQLFNPQTNDETPVIGFNEKLILRFDDLSNGSTAYRYTIKHYDRNWEDDGLFFTEYAKGSLNGQINNFDYSFNTLQAYTHYQLTFPNETIQPKISGNFKIIVYEYDEDEPIFTQKFCVVEKGAELALNISRTSDAQRPQLNQRVQVRAVGEGAVFTNNANGLSLNLIQNNRWQSGFYDLMPSSNLGNQLLFQQRELAFAGNNEFYYFDNKNIRGAFDMVADTKIIDGKNHTYLHPVWAFPLNYQFQGDVNGAFYFRRNDLGIERDANKEGDYAWVYFSLDSEPVEKEIYVLGVFNDYQPNEKSRMYYDEKSKKYIAKIYLKQGFYSYQLATKDADGNLNFGEINGNFWQTENLYQAFLYYRPFGQNYDGLLGYGEFRKPIH